MTLIVDDEPDILRSMADLLRKDCYVTATDDIDEAIRQIEMRSYALIIADQRMPALSGTDLLTMANSLCPDAYRILMSGYSDMSAVVKAVNEGRIHYYLSKPLEAQTLINLVHRVARQNAISEEYRETLLKLSKIELQASNAQQMDYAGNLAGNDFGRDRSSLNAILEHLTRICRYKAERETGALDQQKDAQEHH